MLLREVSAAFHLTPHLWIGGIEPRAQASRGHLVHSRKASALLRRQRCRRPSGRQRGVGVEVELLRAATPCHGRYWAGRGRPLCLDLNPRELWRWKSRGSATCQTKVLPTNLHLHWVSTYADRLSLGDGPADGASSTAFEEWLAGEFDEFLGDASVMVASGLGGEEVEAI